MITDIFIPPKVSNLGIPMPENESAIWSAVRRGDFRALARAISYIENGVGDFHKQLMQLSTDSSSVVGITGPPGAGKSTLVDALIRQLVSEQKKVAVLCVDPSSSFHTGALLGDRVRMSEWYNNPGVFIRSLSSRGAIGGLHPQIVEIASLMQAAGFDYVLLETVGVGQTEVEVAALADMTMLVLVPEAGDDVQMMKAGVMEIADLFVVNKADRPGADAFIRHLLAMQAYSSRWKDRQIPAVKTVATKNEGIPQVVQLVHELLKKEENREKKCHILAERAFLLIQQQRMRNVKRTDLYRKIAAELGAKGSVNLFQLVAEWT